MEWGLLVALYICRTVMVVILSKYETGEHENHEEERGQGSEETMNEYTF